MALASYICAVGRLLVVVQIALLMTYVLWRSRGKLRGLHLLSSVSLFAAGYVVPILGMPITWLLTGIETAFPLELMETVLLASFVGLVSWGFRYFARGGPQLGPAGLAWSSL